MEIPLGCYPRAGRFVKYDTESGWWRRSETPPWIAGQLCRSLGSDFAIYRDPKAGAIYVQRGRSRVRRDEVAKKRYRRVPGLFSSLSLVTKDGSRVRGVHRFTFLELSGYLEFITRDELGRESDDPLYYLLKICDQHDEDFQAWKPVDGSVAWLPLGTKSGVATFVAQPKV